MKLNRPIVTMTMATALVLGGVLHLLLSATGTLLAAVGVGNRGKNDGTHITRPPSTGTAAFDVYVDHLSTLGFDVKLLS